jgi:pyruvate,orthophosphate dikinase
VDDESWEGARLYAIAPGAVLPPGGAAEVGNKAFNLMRMAEAGLTVPPGFVLPTGWCRRQRAGLNIPDALARSLREGMSALEPRGKRRFGCERAPLLVSVRSGAAVSMPGMMETVLDVGLNAASTEGLIRLTGNPRLAWDCYRRLVAGYAEVVQGLPAEPFARLVAQTLAEEGAEAERELDHRALRRLTQGMLGLYRELAGAPFPEDPHEQLLRAAEAVLRSWDAPKARTYRALQGLDDFAGTAVTVQTMVYGNASGDSGSGVGFTRNPATGEHELYLDFQFNGQGEDVVAGRHAMQDSTLLRRRLPAVWSALEATCRTLEGLFGDAQDFEFTVQSSTLFLLQARCAKRTPWAALRIAVDLVAEGLIAPAEALHRLHGIEPESVTRTRLAGVEGALVAEARIASPGVAVGVIALDPQEVERMAREGRAAILVRRETATEDIVGIAACVGLLTATGGRTSHAAVVARQLRKVCLVGCSELSIDMAARRCSIGGRDFAEGDCITLDGNAGTVIAGRAEVVIERPERELAAIAGWRAATA